MPDIIQEAQGVFSFSLFASDVCQSFLHELREANYWSDATVGKKAEDWTVNSIVEQSFRRASVIFLQDLPRLYSEFDLAIEQKVKPILLKVWNLSLNKHRGAQVVRYKPGGHYRPHADAALDMEDRYVTVLCYLNDDFEGGQTTFTYLNNLSIQPASGKAIIFPSTYVHQAEPVLSGEKFVIVTWLTGPSPIRWI
jgi:hypothetical protein